MRRVLTMMCAAAIALAAAAPARAAQDAETKELLAYRLTREGLTRYAAVMKAMVVEMKKDPRLAELSKLEAEMERLTSKDNPTAADEKRIEAIEARMEQLEEATSLSMTDGSLADIEARIRKNPTMLAAVNAGGMAPREYAKFTIVLVQAGMAVGMKRAGLLKELPKEVAPENVQFVEQHEKELEALQRQMEAIGR